MSLATPLTSLAQNKVQVLIARNDTTTTFINTAVNVDVLANDEQTNPSFDLELFSIVRGPMNGDAEIDYGDSGGGLDDDTILYTPDNNFVGVDSLRYRIRSEGGIAGEEEAEVYIFINEAPVGNDDSFVVVPNTATQLDVLANDTDTEGDSLRIEDIVVEPENGMATITPRTGAPQVITYTPDDDFTGEDSLRYALYDGLNGRDSAWVNIIVNASPVANDDAAMTSSGTMFTINVLANDTDAEDDPLTITAVTPPSNGTAVISNGMIVYTSDASFDGTDTFTYTVSDGNSTDTATVTVTVDPSMFTAILSGANEVPPNASGDEAPGAPAFSLQSISGTGTVNATLNGNTLTVTGSFDDLESDFNGAIGAHIHRGFAGQNGSPVFTLTVTPDADDRGGSISGSFTLTSAQMQDLQDRRYYVNVHTVDLPAGSIRGQLLPANADATFRVALSGRAEVPSNGSNALGGAIAELTGNTLVVSGAFSGLESDFDALIGGGAHIHQADLGENGGIIFNLTTTLDSDDRGGVFDPTQNTFTLTNAQRTALQNDLFYVNIHSDEIGSGELRGQILPMASRVFEFWLSGQNEVPAIETSASGGGIAVLEGDVLRVAASFAGLESNFNTAVQGGAHLHGAPVGENGGILFDLNTDLETNQQAGTFEPEDNTFTLTSGELAMLLDGEIYVNIHSVDQAGGELRGQVLISTNVAPEAAALTTPTDGLTIDITGDPGDPFEVEWTDAVDPNGNDIVYRWQLALGSDFSDVLFEAEGLTETSVSTTFGEVAALLTANGVGLNESVTLYHRVVTSDGSFGTEGQAFTVRLTRGTITANEDADDLPTTFALHGNFPNPFNPSTTIRFDLPETADVRVEVIDILGRRVMTMAQQQVAAGSNRSLQLDASRLASGTYLYRIVAQTASDTMVETGRMTLIK